MDRNSWRHSDIDLPICAHVPRDRSITTEVDQMRAVILCCILIVALSVFSVEATTSTVCQTDQGVVGLAISGPLASATFIVVQGQQIHSRLSVENIGDITINVSLTWIIDSGPNDTECISVLIPSARILSPDDAESFNVDFLINTTERIVVLILVSGLGIDPATGNAVSAGAGARIEFLPGGTAYSLRVNIVDQWDRSYRGIDVFLSRDSLQYSVEQSDENGSVWYLVSNASYRLRFFENKEFKKSMIINVFEDREIQVMIPRKWAQVSPPTFPLVEIIAGFALGYFVHWFEVRRRKSKDVDSIEELWDWATGGVD